MSPALAEQADWRYRLVFALASPLIIGYTLWQAHKHGGIRYLRQRLGFYSNSRHCTASAAQIWVHAASVGEIVTVLPLIRTINTPVLVTTTTPTGAAALAQENLDHVTHEYLPLDFSSACQRFLKNTKLREGWIVETEIWPCLFASAKRQQLSLTIINARMTDKTSKLSTGFLSAAFSKALQRVTILARSQDDAQRYLALGAQPELTRVVGNLKYSHTDTKATHSQALINRDYFLAASTHEDEELQLALEWSKRYQTIADSAILVIVPRHPQRGEKIASQLASHGLSAARRSRNEPLSGTTTIYLADTLGELSNWYPHAIACFVGGSLIERGGHNMLEPARLKCPIAVGPHTFNFNDIVADFLEHESICVAQNVTEICDFFAAVSKDESKYEQIAERARQRAIASEQVLNDYLTTLGGCPRIS